MDEEEKACEKSLIFVWGNPIKKVEAKPGDIRVPEIGSNWFGSAATPDGPVKGNSDVTSSTLLALSGTMVSGIEQKVNSWKLSSAVLVFLGMVDSENQQTFAWGLSL